LTEGGRREDFCHKRPLFSDDRVVVGVFEEVECGGSCLTAEKELTNIELQLSLVLEVFLSFKDVCESFSIYATFTFVF
jgi:hypothetical protein